MKEEIVYKIDSKEWPVVPSNFREYEEIYEYVPSPGTSDESIKKRIRSEKVPLECGPECTCVA